MCGRMLKSLCGDGALKGKIGPVYLDPALATRAHMSRL